MVLEVFFNLLFIDDEGTDIWSGMVSLSTASLQKLVEQIKHNFKGCVCVCVCVCVYVCDTIQ